MDAPTEKDIAVGNDGERMIVVNLFGYYAHLSIYHFASRYCSGLRVLDAGSGVGYGAAYFARHGADVLALDAGADAIAYARQRYAGDSVTYEIADLNQPLPLGDAVFDVVFSSNVFEHVANIDGLAAECARVVKRDGTVIVAVPPVTSAADAQIDMRNRFHVHHIPPEAWQAKLVRFFEKVECHAHIGAGKWRELQQTEITKPADQVTIRETDFEFPLCRPSDLHSTQSLTAVFVCRLPRSQPLPETLLERTPAAWHEAAIAAKIIGEERAAAEQHRAVAQRHAADLERAAAENAGLIRNLQVARDEIRDLKIAQDAFKGAALAAQRAAAETAGLIRDLQVARWDFDSWCVKTGLKAAVCRGKTENWRIW